MISPWHLRAAARILSHGGIVAYPTEAVYGLGCDPQCEEALERIIDIKGRAAAKGFIVLAAHEAQIAPYVRPLAPDVQARVAATWPGPVTWILPAADDLPPILTGWRDTVAVRVTAHPDAAALCRAFGGAIVSTSANRTGRPAARNPFTVRRTFGAKIDYLLHGNLSGAERPTEIRDSRSGRIIRPG